MNVKPRRRIAFASSLILQGFVLSGLLFGCAGDSGLPCKHLGQPAGPGVVLDVWDAKTGVPLAEGVSGIVSRNGAFEDSLQRSWGNVFWGMVGEAGIYDVEVSKAGYEDWHAEGVQVEAEACDIVPTKIRVDLVSRVIVGFQWERLTTACDSALYAIPVGQGQIRVAGVFVSTCPFYLLPGPWRVAQDSLFLDTIVIHSPHYCESPPCYGGRYVFEMKNLRSGEYNLTLRHVIKYFYSDETPISTEIVLQQVIDVP